VTLWTACDDAKEKKKPCDYSSSSEDSSTTGGLCYLDGCDEEPSGKREGPGKSFDCSCTGTSLKSDLIRSRRPFRRRL
jgi:hypothetical protein